MFQHAISYAGRAPGKALDIDRSFDGTDLCAAGSLWLASDGEASGDIGVSVRIGITKDAVRPLRFFLKGSKFVSGPASLNAALWLRVAFWPRNSMRRLWNIGDSFPQIDRSGLTEHAVPIIYRASARQNSVFCRMFGSTLECKVSQPIRNATRDRRSDALLSSFRIVRMVILTEPQGRGSKNSTGYDF